MKERRPSIFIIQDPISGGFESSSEDFIPSHPTEETTRPANAFQRYHDGWILEARGENLALQRSWGEIDLLAHGNSDGFRAELD